MISKGPKRADQFSMLGKSCSNFSEMSVMSTNSKYGRNAKKSSRSIRSSRSRTTSARKKKKSKVPTAGSNQHFLHNHIKNISRPVVFTAAEGVSVTEPSQIPPRPQGVQLDPSLQKEDETISGGRPPLPKLEDGQKRFRNFAKTGGFNEVPVEKAENAKSNHDAQ